MAKKTPEALFRTGGAVEISAGLPAVDAGHLLGRIFGDCRIKALIGEGGMGRAYRAERADGPNNASHFAFGTDDETFGGA